MLPFASGPHEIVTAWPLLQADVVAAVLEFVARMVEALVWPLILVGFLWLFRDPLRSLIANLRTATVEVGGNKVTVEQFTRAVETSTSIGMASGKKTSKTSRSDDQEVREIADAVTKTLLSGVHDLRAGVSVLWVDDQPAEIDLERKAFDGIGLSVTHVESTEAALAELQAENYALVISDGKRGDDDEAAFTLLREMRARGVEKPLIVYTHRDASGAYDEGAFGVAQNPRELLDLVLKAAAR